MAGTSSRQVALSVARAQLVPPSASGQSCRIRASGDVYIGGADVTIANGYLWNGAPTDIDLLPGCGIWGVLAAGALTGYAFIEEQS